MNLQKIFVFGGMTITFCLDDVDTGGQITMFEVSVKADARMPVPHYHNSFDESVYMLQGQCTFTVDGQQRTYNQGECCFIPRGIVHGFENQGVEECRFLSVVTPGTLSSSYFSDIAAIMNVNGAADITKLKAVMQTHGLVPVID